MNYYNEFDPKAAAWLRALIAEGLIPDGYVDERSIVDVRGSDLDGYTQCHFFAGIGGWAKALELASFPTTRPVWTGSCPCQPFSSASRGRGGRLESDRHLWPEWFRLIRECKPDCIFGEQVADALDWLDTVADDLEAEGYTFRAADIPACAVGADHIRHRIYFQGYTDRYRQSGGAIHAEASRVPRARGYAGTVVPAHGLPNRVAALRAFGNAIVPQVAAAFIEAAA